MFSSAMKFRHQGLIHVHDCCLSRKTQLLEADDTIADEFTRLAVYFCLTFALQCFTFFSFNLSKSFSVLMFHILCQLALNTFPNRLPGSRTPLKISSYSETCTSESGWFPIITTLIRSFGFELKDVVFVATKVQDFICLSYLKIESVLLPRRRLEQMKAFLERVSRTYIAAFFLGLIGVNHRKTMRPKFAMVSWRHSPRIWTWPWLGSLWSYTRDPLGFIQKHQRSQGDVFTTTILGYNCTFIQSSEYIRSFSTATRKSLDVTAAYKLVVAPLIGEEAFFGQTKYMNQVVLSKSRIEQLHERLWELAEQLIEIKWSKCLPSGHQSEDKNWQQIDVAQLLDYVIFGLDMYVLTGEQMMNVNLDRITQLFRVIDSDLSLLGILLPMLKGGRCPRKDAKDELLGFLKRDVKRRVERHVQRAINVTLGPCHFDCGEDWYEDDHADQSAQELPDLLLCSELKDLDESIMLEYHRGEQSAIDAVNEKVEFIALFIYGFVWAAQTNSAAATIGLVHDILFHDQPHLSNSGECAETRPVSHVDRIRKECASALLKEKNTAAPRYENMPHLTHCLNETLRLRATGAWIRLAEKPFHLVPQATDQLPSVICPPGFIVLSPMSVSLNPMVYPSPKRWDPFRYERAPFISASPGSGNDPARHIPLHKTYLIPPTQPSTPYFASWGLGQCHCPGKHLAYKMISMTVARFFQKFEARPLEDRYEAAKFQDIAAAGVQRLNNGFPVLIRKREF